MNWVEKSIGEVQRWRHVVCKTRNSVKLSRCLLWLPNAEKLDQQVVGEAGVEHLADEENVGGQSRLQHDGHVGSIEKTDWVRSASSTLTGGLDWDLDTETLEVDDRRKDNESGEEVHDVGQILSVESLVESTLLVWPCQEQVEERNDCALKFRSTASVDGGRGKRFPDNRFANVGGNEKGNTASETVSLLQKLVKENDNQTSNNQLKNEEEDNTSAKI